MRVFSIPKGTGTYADSLRAIGTADLLEAVSGTQTIIRDMGTHFQIECKSDVPLEQWRPPSPGFYYIWRKSKEKEKPSGTLVLDYEEEQRRAKAKENGKNKKKRGALNKALEEQGLTLVETVHREYRPAAILASMRMGDGYINGWKSDRVVYHWLISNSDKALKWMQSELGRLERLDQLEPFERFDLPEVSNSQFFNPVSGKGVHAAKTNYKSPGAISSEVVEPFAEWMKYRGAYNAMLPYRTGDDFQTLCH